VPILPQAPPAGRLLIRSRIVLPVSQPPIEDGAVLIAGSHFAAVGPWKDLATSDADTLDLGDSIVMPGLVNAHCHLDYTRMAGLLPPQKLFTDWIKLMLAAKAEWAYSDFAESWLTGAKMLLRTGTTTVADIEAVPELLPEVWTATPLRVISLIEMTGVRCRRNPHLVLEEALRCIEALPNGRCRAGLSPHAPYSTMPELVRLSARTARERQWPLAIHVSESDLEFEMFTRARGEMFHWLRRNERDMSDCGLGSPVRHLERCDGLTENLLAVHVNYLARGDAQILAKHHVSVVHCPRSHAYFRHRAFPYERLARAGVNVCLGSDSLATVLRPRREDIRLNMFDEMRAFAKAHPRVAASRILNMATRHGARALGLAGKIGELSPGAHADLIAIPFRDGKSEAVRAVIEHEGDVSASMIDGEWAIAPGTR